MRYILLIGTMQAGRRRTRISYPPFPHSLRHKNAILQRSPQQKSTDSLVFENGIASPLPAEFEFAICLIGNVAQCARDRNHVDEREPGMARGPAEVLVAVRAEFCTALVVGIYIFSRMTVK